jgi:pimeloyl-ACP methyl ester carboxylesterase
VSVLLWTAAVTAALFGIGYAYEKVQESRDRRLYPAPGKIVDVGGRRMHIFCQGNAVGPTVIIEQGAGSPSLVWRPVQATIAKFARVCTYDRAGYQWSDPVEADRGLDDRVADLHAVLERAEVPAPYILVGHSLGGLIVRRFARVYPDQTAGMILVDSPDEPVVFRESMRAFYVQGVRMQRILRAAARFGLVRLLGRYVPMLMLPDDAMGYALCVRPEHAAAAADDLRALLNAPQTVRQPEPPGSLGDRPLVVLSHGVPFPPMAAVMEAGWTDGQDRLSHLSSDSALIVAEKSGHLIHIDEPELVVESVRRVHAAVRDGTRLANSTVNSR